MSLTPAARRWSAIIDEYESSGLTQRAFAKARGIHPSTLAAWRSKLGRCSTQRAINAGFTELVVREEDAAAEGDAADNERSVLASAALVIRLGSRDAEVVVEHDTDLALLRRVVDALC